MSRKIEKVVCRASWRKVFSAILRDRLFQHPQAITLRILLRAFSVDVILQSLSRLAKQICRDSAILNRLRG